MLDEFDDADETARQDALAMRSAIELVELIEAEVHRIEDFQSRRQLGAEALLQSALRRAESDDESLDNSDDVLDVEAVVAAIGNVDSALQKGEKGYFSGGLFHQELPLPVAHLNRDGKVRKGHVKREADRYGVNRRAFRGMALQYFACEPFHSFIRLQHEKSDAYQDACKHKKQTEKFHQGRDLATPCSCIICRGSIIQDILLHLFEIPAK